MFLNAEPLPNLLQTQALCMPTSNLFSTKTLKLCFLKLSDLKLQQLKLCVVTDASFVGTLKAPSKCQLHLIKVLMDFKNTTRFIYCHGVDVLSAFSLSENKCEYWQQ